MMPSSITPEVREKIFECVEQYRGKRPIDQALFEEVANQLHLSSWYVASKYYYRHKKLLKSPPSSQAYSSAQYEEWVGLVASRGLSRERARDLVDSVIKAASDRVAWLVDLFGYMRRRVRWDGNYAKDIKWLEVQRDRMAKDPRYWPQLKPLLPDILAGQVQRELRKGPKTPEQIRQTLRLTGSQIKSVGVRMRKSRQIVSIRRDGKAMWALAATHAADVKTTDSVLAALAQGEKTNARIASNTGIKRSTIKRAIRILRDKGKVVLSGPKTYALAGTGPAYSPPPDAIETSLKKNGEMSAKAIAEDNGIELWTVQRYLCRLRHLKKPKIIFTSRSTYALAGTRPAYVPTRDVVVAALTKKRKMSLGALVQTGKSRGKSPSAVHKAVTLLHEEGVIEKVRLGVYRLTRGKRRRGLHSPSA